MDLTFTGGGTDNPTFVDEDPTGTFNYVYAVTSATENGTVDVDATMDDLAGNTGTATTQQFVVNKYEIVVTVDLQAVNVGITRDVTFVITNCGETPDTRTESVTVVGATGQGTVTLTDVDRLADWISADEGHTLRSLLPVTFDGNGDFDADFVGADELLAGDFTGDNLVDVEDFALLALNFNTLGSAADATGDGLQGSADFTAIVANFFVEGDENDTCSRLGGNYDSIRQLTKPLASISARSLSTDAGWAADVNADGWVDVSDVRAFAKLHGLSIDKQAERKLRSLERKPNRLGYQR